MAASPPIADARLKNGKRGVWMQKTIVLLRKRKRKRRIGHQLGIGFGNALHGLQKDGPARPLFFFLLSGRGTSRSLKQIADQIREVGGILFQSESIIPHVALGYFRHRQTILIVYHQCLRLGRNNIDIQ